MPPIAVKNYKGVAVEWVKNEASAENEEMAMREAILDQVLAANDIQVPQDLVDHEITRMVMELKHKKKYESMMFGGYSDFMEGELADPRERFREEAFKLVKTRIVLEGIIAAENFEVSKAELEEEAKVIAVRQQLPVEMVKEFLGEDLELLRDDVLVRKAMDLVCASAVIKEETLLPPVFQR